MWVTALALCCAVCAGERGRRVVEMCSRSAVCGGYPALFYWFRVYHNHTACVSRILSQIWYVCVCIRWVTHCMFVGCDMSHCIFVGSALHTIFEWAALSYYICMATPALQSSALAFPQ